MSDDMKPPPAIQVLLTNRQTKEMALRAKRDQRATYQQYVDSYDRGIGELEAEIADIDKAIDALSYPD